MKLLKNSQKNEESVLTYCRISGIMLFVEEVYAAVLKPQLSHIPIKFQKEITIMARNPGVLTKNPNVIKWVDEMVALTKPDQVIWIDGSKEQLDELTNEVCSLPDGNKDKMYRPGEAPRLPVSQNTPQRCCKS